MYLMTSHYLLFGPQNNSWGNKLYTKNIGNYVVFKVPININTDNWIDYQPLTEYFEKIKFDPQDLLFSDCYTCGHRWDTVCTYNDINDIISIVDNYYRDNKVLMIHDIETSTVTQHGEFIEGTTVLNDEETDKFYNILSRKAEIKDDWDELSEYYSLRLWFHNN